MSMPAYISITGKNQGLITKDAFTKESVGNIFVEGHTDEIFVQAIEHEMKLPTHVESGLPSGLCQPGPFTFTSTMNKATPLLYQALCNAETLTEVVVKWWRFNIDGDKEHFFTTRLVDATIVKIETVLPHVQKEDSAQFGEQVKVSMAYRKMLWSHDVARTDGSYDWRVPKETQV